MGRFVTSLLAIVLQLYAFSSILADEQVRQVQAALRQRHLFYANATGEMSPELSAAIARYQEKKGFPRTGSIDAETCASLGIVRPIPLVDQTPFVVERDGVVRGANGEALPDTLPWPPDRYPVLFTLTPTEPDNFVSAPAAPETEPAPKPVALIRLKVAPPPCRRARPQPQKETNPIVLAFRSFDHAVKFLFGDKDQKKKRTPPKRS